MSFNMKADEVILSATDVSKCYNIYSRPRDRLFQGLSRGRKKFYKEFWALQGISFNLKKGHALGIIGKNGSGKSTLLQIICGTLTPTSGTVSVSGRIGALLELGSGFNPEFTGVENVFINGSVLGLSKREIQDRLDDILAFADIGDFVHQPVKTYSSGMAVRLAFAVQAHISPDLLIVDEALGVGDEMFQKKCFSHIAGLREEGTSILLVTHNGQQITRYCDEALLLDSGKMIVHGSPKRVLVSYQQLPRRVDKSLADDAGGRICKSEIEGNKPFEGMDATLTECGAWLDSSLSPESTQKSLSTNVEIIRVEFQERNGIPINKIPFGEEFWLSLTVKALQDLKDIYVGCSISSHQGVRITGQNTGNSDLVPELAKIKKNQEVMIRFAFQGCLWPGIYFSSCGVLKQGNDSDFLHRIIDAAVIQITDSEGISPTPIGLIDAKTRPPEITGLTLQEP